MDQQWTAQTVRAIVAPTLAYPVILGGPFLKSNKIVIDHEFGKVVAKDALYQLIPLVADRPEDVQVLQVTPNPEERKTRQDLFRELQERMTHLKLFEELRERTKERKVDADHHSMEGASHRHFARTLDNRIQVFAVWDELEQHDRELREEFKDRFPTDIPHVTRLPDDVYHKFRLKDPEKVIRCRSYPCPKKYRNAWKQMLDQHLAAGRIRESSSEYCSPSFLIPKADPMVLPRWVNNY